MVSDKSIGQTFWTAAIIFSASEGLSIRVLFVKIKAVRFPVLVQAEIQIKFRLPFQPRDVRADFGGLWNCDNRGSRSMPSAFSRLFKREADGIQARQQKNLRVLRPVIFLDQFQRGERPGGFIAVDAGADVNSDCGLLMRIDAACDAARTI